MAHRRSSLPTAAAAGLACFAWALPASGQAIFTCIDAQGRRLTADRPILECNDRDQRELNRDGTLRRIVPPPPTAAERAAAAEKARQDAEEQHRQAEERQRKKALLLRFPDSATLAREREASLVTIRNAIANNLRRANDLMTERRRLEDEASFYVKDPARIPQSLRQRIEDNARHLKGQEQLLQDQEQERLRIVARFDEAQRELAPIWAGQAQ